MIGYWAGNYDNAAAPVSFARTVFPFPFNVTWPAPASSDIAPYVRLAVADMAQLLPYQFSPEMVVGWTIPVNRCTTCGRTTGDQRVTESFLVG